MTDRVRYKVTIEAFVTWSEDDYESPEEWDELKEESKPTTTH